MYTSASSQQHYDPLQRFTLRDTTGSIFVCRGLGNTDEDALRTCSSEWCPCILLQKKTSGESPCPFNMQLIYDPDSNSFDFTKTIK